MISVSEFDDHISNGNVAESESTEQQENRLNKLAGFQLMMIRHAMKCKPLSLDGHRHAYDDPLLIVLSPFCPTHRLLDM